MNGTVLIVDDEKDFLSLCKRVFEKKGYSVILAENFNQAMKAIRFSDVMILDYDIGIPNGEQVLKNISEKNDLIPVIMVSGMFPNEITIQNWKDMGIFSYMKKPVDFNSLIKDINESIYLKRVTDLAENACLAIEKMSLLDTCPVSN